MNGNPPKKQRGCFFYGCITGLVLLLLATILAVCGLLYVKNLVNQWTDTKALSLPAVEMPAADMEELKARVKAFQDSVEHGSNSVPLVLTGRDLNALITQNEDLKGKFHIEIEDSKVKGQVSIPLPALPFLRGRYLNGSGTFAGSIRNSRLVVNVQNLEVKGKAFPESFMAKLRAENLAADVQQNNPDLEETLGKLQSLEVKDGKVTIVPRQKQTPLPEEPSQTNAVPQVQP